MISHNFRCIFVHIPKTAGNSINRVFGVEWQDHKDLARYAAEQPADIFQRYFKFAIVRNPWDRLFSDYNYQRKKSRPKDSKLFLFDEGGRQRNFAAWVEAALARADACAPRQWGGEVSPHIHRWSPQLEWITVAGNPAVDFVARLENLAIDFPIICRQVGLPPNHLPHRNRRLHWHYSHYYDRRTREIVADYYAQDIAAFGYDFEDRRFHLHVIFGATRPGGSREAIPAEPAQTERTGNSPGQTRTVAPLSGRSHPPQRRRRLTAVFAAGIIAATGWMGSAFLRSPMPGDETPPEVNAAAAFTPTLRFLRPQIVRYNPTSAPLSELRFTVALTSTLTLGVPLTTFTGDLPAGNQHVTPSAPRHWSSPPPAFASHGDAGWFRRLRRGS